MVLTNIALCVLAGVRAASHRAAAVAAQHIQVRDAANFLARASSINSGTVVACLPGSLPGSDLSLRMPACVCIGAGNSRSRAARDLGDRRLQHRPGGPGQRIARGNELVGPRAGRLQRPCDRCGLSRCAPRHHPMPFTAVLCGNALLRLLQRISSVCGMLRRRWRCGNELGSQRAR